MTTDVDAPSGRAPDASETGSSSTEDDAVRIPALAPGVELLGEMPGSGYRQAPSLVRRSDGQTLQLTPLLYGVLEEIDGSRGYPEIAERLSAKIGKAAAAEDVQYLVQKKLQPLGLLRLADGSEPVPQKANPLLALRPRVVLSDPEVTRKVTRPFARLFAPLLVIPLLVAFLAATGWVLFDKGLGAATHQAFYQPGLLLAIFGLTVLSAGFHEFGHAAACRYGGATPGVMGFGLYIVWPAFYTDVSDSYRLDRRRRLWVDLGGLYFNAIFSVLAFGLWIVTGWDALLLVVGTQVLQMLRQLTPVIRADGYHILADLTGVPDLFAHIKPTIRSLWPGNWRNRDTRTLKRWARVLVIAWVALIVPSLLFALVSGAVMMPRLIATAWDSLGVQWHALTAGAGNGDAGRALLSVLKMFAVVLPVAGTILMLGRLVLRSGRKAWAATASDPPRRGLLLVAVAGIILALGWVWWPRAQYQPIRSDERGTVVQLPGLLRAASTGSVRPVASSSATTSRVRIPALLLVPRAQPGAAVRPALVVVGGADGGPPKILAVPPAPAAGPPADPAATPARNPWPFPFPPPQKQRPGDNRALTVNTTDGSAVYDVAFSMVWVTGQDVTQRNEAIALADCTHCRSVSVAFQTVFILGQSNVATPVNTSLAVNYGCRDCQTTAIAVQLVASLTALPDPATMAQLTGLWRQLDELAAEIPNLSDAEIYARLKGMESAILQTLDQAGTSVAEAADTAAAGSTTPGSGDPAASPSPSPAVTGPGGTASTPAGSGTPEQSGTSGAGTGSTPTQPGNNTDPSSTTSPAPSATPSTTTTSTGDPTGSSGSTASQEPVAAGTPAG